MAWIFADGFDLYAAVADMTTGYWDSGVASTTAFTAGRFAGSQAIGWNNTAFNMVKSSGVNDTVHHIACAFRQTAAISGTTLGAYLQLLDGATGQCAIVFKSNGDILLTSGTAAGAVLATYAGAFPVTNTWYQFEFEIVINNTTGSFKVRKNGNPSDDHSTTGLNTRGGTANNYANSLKLGIQAALSSHQFDDFFWRSDASSVAWLGDIRCITRMPASDASVAFSRTPATYAQASIGGASTTVTPSVTSSYYLYFIAAYDGTIATANVTVNAGYTGNLKCAAFASASVTTGNPSTVLATATTLANPVTGSNVITFPTPFTVVRGNQYWIGVASDTAAASALSVKTSSGAYSTTTGYSAFPAASPAIAGTSWGINHSTVITTTINAQMANEAQQNALTDYVYSSTAGQEDFYNIAAIASTPATVIATTVRAYALKSDAGTRTLAAQIKSGATTVASSTVVLTTSGWQWAWRTDTVDPATGVAWTPAAVNVAQIGPKVIA